MRDWFHRRSPKYWPKWYRITLGCSAAGALLGGALAWFGPAWGRYLALIGFIACALCLWLLQDLLLEGPGAFGRDD